jgi:hypothetical protein
MFNSTIYGRISKRQDEYQKKVIAWHKGRRDFFEKLPEPYTTNTRAHLTPELFKECFNLDDKVYHWGWQHRAATLMNKRLRENKLKAPGNKTSMTIIVDDYEGPLEVNPKQILLRTSMRKSQRNRGEYIFPATTAPRQPHPTCPGGMRPVVGFCGALYPRQPWRKPLIDQLTADPRIVTNFVLRKGFWNQGAGGTIGDKSLVVDFEENMKNSQFTVCCRGSGNFSFRFYETLAAGRIPALLDDDTCLPFEEYIDYSKIIVIGKTPQQVADGIWKVWRSGDVEAMQTRCAQVSKEFLQQPNYSKKLLEQLKKDGY